jgi:hypothetical protein
MKKQMEEAWKLLDNLTPLKTDCGALCASACCRPDEDGQGGVTLFPGEEEMYRDTEWARIEDGILYCDGHCPRDMRPLGCRIFPLTPYRKKDLGLGVRVDRRAFSMCPLAPDGVRALDPAFVRAALEALFLVDQTPEGRKFLHEWISKERIFRNSTL